MKKLIIPFVFLAPQLVWAADVVSEASSGSGLRALGAALAISIGALGGALGQGRLAASAMEGIARNPQSQKAMFVPFMIGLGLIESLVIYCLIVAMILAG